MIHIILLFILIIPHSFAEVWIIHVYTGHEQFSGTDSKVYIRLFNSKDESTGEYQLTHSNWLPERQDFPLRNLFETSAHERFRIRTEDIGSVAKIQVRLNHFLFLNADWLLDKVIVEQDRNGTKVIFKCNCWIRQPRLHVTITALPDPSLINKGKADDAYASSNRAVVIILVVLITIVTVIFCGINEYRRRQRHIPMFLNDPIDPMSSETMFNYPHYPPIQSQLSPSASDSHSWLNTLRRWKDSRHGLPSYNHASAASSTSVPQAASAEEPPSYDELYPTSMPSTNTTATLPH